MKNLYVLGFDVKGTIYHLDKRARMLELLALRRSICNMSAR